MNRPIMRFELDGEEHWFAQLSCGHTQHTRHTPPVVERPWVLTAEGRDAKLGSLLDCVACDRFEIPETHAPYQQTPHFDQETVPKGLLKQHSTKVGVWALIHVVEGKLSYTVEPPVTHHSVLTPSSPGIVIPEVLHCVEPQGAVRFYVEFWKAL